VATIKVNIGEPIDLAISRFKAANRKEGLFEEIQKRSFYMTRSEKRRAKIKLNAHKRAYKKKIKNHGDRIKC